MKRIIYCIHVDKWKEDMLWRKETGLPEGLYRPYVNEVELEFLVDEETATIFKFRHPHASITDGTRIYGRPEGQPWTL